MTAEDGVLASQTSRFTHYYFYIRDEVLGPIIVRVASFFPFHATYWLNGHSFIEQELNRGKIGFQKNDNACSPWMMSQRYRPPPTA